MRGDKSETSLVIGGTGMLAAATHWLIERSRETVLVARGADRFRPHDNAVIAVNADWNNADFASVLTSALRNTPPINRALLWLHEPEPILVWLLPLIRDARIVLVVGSLDGRPSAPSTDTQIATVRLGSVSTPQGRRWLTHDEISNGAIQALQDGLSSVVGELAPI